MTNLSQETVPSLAAPEPVANRPKRAGLRPMLPTLTPSLAIGGAMTLAIVLFGIIAPFFGQDPRAVSNIGLTAPSSDHLLGTT